MSDAAPAQPQDIAVKNPGGEIVTIPADQVAQALRAGYAYATPQEYQDQANVNAHSTTGQQIATGAEGFGQGLVPGFPAAEAALAPDSGSIAEQDARKAANPGIHRAGQFIGSAAQMAGVAAATGGLGELGEGAALAGEGAEGLAGASEGVDAASQVLPGAQAAADIGAGADATGAVQAAGSTPGAISDGADALVTQGPQSLAEAQAGATSNGLSGYAQQAAAGAASGGTDYVNESELGDHNFNGQALAMDMGLGALLGAGSEGAINVLKDTVAPAVFSKAGDALDALKNKLGDVFVKSTEALNPEAKGLVRPAWEAIKGGAEKATDATAEDLSGSINKASDELAAVGKTHQSDFRPGEAKANLADTPTSQVLGTGAPQAHGLLSVSSQVDQAMGNVKTLLDDGTYEGKGAFNNITRAKNAFDAELAKPDATAFDLHQATVRLKQSVGESGIFDRGVMSPEQTRAVNDLTHNVWAPVKQALSDKAIWGEEQAGRNALIDQATAQKINAAKQLAKDFGASEVDLETGKKELYIKPSKIRAALTGDPLANQEKLRHLEDYVTSAKNYLDAVKTSAGNAGAVVPGGDDLHALLESVTAQRRAAQAMAPITELQKKLATSQRWGFGAMGVAPVVGLGAHAAGAAMPVVAPLVAGAAALRAPVKAMQMFAKVSGAAATARDAISSGVRKMLGSPLVRTEVTGSAVGALRGLTFRSAGGAASGGDFQKQSKHISELAADGQRQMSTLAENTSRLSSVAPQTTMALHQASLRALQVLNAALPKNPAPSPLPAENKDWQPNGTQLAAWNDLHAAVLKPTTFLGQLHDGTASPDTWAALQTVYPSWAKQVQQSTTDYLAAHPKLDLGVGQKLAVSMVLGSAISPTVSPAQVAFQQQVYEGNSEPPQPAPHGRGHPTQHGLDKIDIAARTAPGHQRSR